MKYLSFLGLLSLIGCSGCGHTPMKLTVQCAGMPILSTDVRPAVFDESVSLDSDISEKLSCHVEIYEAK